MKFSEDPHYVPALGFHWLTPYYDALVALSTRERSFKQALIRQAGIAAGQQVLDLACGTGTLAIWLKTAHPEAAVTGLDGDPQVLAIAARKARQAKVAVRFDEGLAYQLPYPQDCFDRVLSSLFFHHLRWEDKERSARELFRVLKPGAQLHVADWGRAQNPLMRALFLPVQLLDGFANTQDNVSGRLPELLAGAGFAQVARRQRFSTLFGTLELLSAVKPAG